MLSHVSIGVRDLAAARRFYDPVFKAIGAKCLAHGEGYAGYGTEAGVFWLNETAHPVPADMRSGLHFCFDAPGRKAVDAFHKAALAHGGKDNGKPGLRPDYGAGYYAAFAIDPDGYRIEAYFGE
jgi:catechol 2,3-dioxygenase-like lactoylglutathione lyase family enzyme